MMDTATEKTTDPQPGTPTTGSSSTPAARESSPPKSPLHGTPTDIEGSMEPLAASDPPGKLYWISDECNAMTSQYTDPKWVNFGNFIAAAQYFASKADERLNDPNDTDFARVFNVIFKTPKNDTEKMPRSENWIKKHGLQNQEFATTIQHVCRDLKSFGWGWERTQDRKVAHVRFNTGGDLKRWIRLRSHSTEKKDDGSSADVYYDPIHHVEFVGDFEKVCKLDAFSSHRHPGADVWSFRRENPERWVIDITQKAWDKYVSDNAFGRTGMEDIDALAHGSMIRLVFREMMHTPEYLLDDVTLVHEGWYGVMQKCKKGEAHRNADSLAMLVLWEQLADSPMMHDGRENRMTMDRDWDSIPGNFDDVNGVDNDKWNPNFPGPEIGPILGEITCYPIDEKPDAEDQDTNSTPPVPVDSEPAAEDEDLDLVRKSIKSGHVASEPDAEYENFVRVLRDIKWEPDDDLDMEDQKK